MTYLDQGVCYLRSALSKTFFAGHPTFIPTPLPPPAILKKEPSPIPYNPKARQPIKPVHHVEHHPHPTHIGAF